MKKLGISAIELDEAVSETEKICLEEERKLKIKITKRF